MIWGSVTMRLLGWICEGFVSGRDMDFLGTGFSLNIVVIITRNHWLTALWYGVIVCISLIAVWLFAFSL